MISSQLNVPLIYIATFSIFRIVRISTDRSITDDVIDDRVIIAPRGREEKKKQRFKTFRER